MYLEFTASTFATHAYSSVLRRLQWALGLCLIKQWLLNLAVNFRVQSFTLIFSVISHKYYVLLFAVAFRIDWMMAYQGMVVLAGNQVWWTWEVEDVFRKVKKGDKMGMKNYARKMHKQISDLVQKVCLLFLSV